MHSIYNHLRCKCLGTDMRHISRIGKDNRRQIVTALKGTVVDACNRSRNGNLFQEAIAGKAA